MRKFLRQLSQRISYSAVLIIGIGLNLLLLLITFLILPSVASVLGALIFAVVYAQLIILFQKVAADREKERNKLRDEFQERHQQLENQRQQLESRHKQLENQQQQMENQYKQIESRQQTFGMQLDSIEQTIKRQHTAVEKSLDNERIQREKQINSVSDLVRQERSQRVAAFARRDSKQSLPENILLLLTVQRVGSTWLLDMLRCHPNIELDPAAIIFDALELKGGRYPVGLSNTPESQMDFENQPQAGNKIPVFPKAHHLLALEANKPYAIEKVHPHFFQNDANAFLERIEQIEAEHNVRFAFIYMIRDPEAVFSSFMAYQRRDPKWYAHLKPEDLPQFMLQEYTVLYELALKRPALILDYSQLKSNPRQVLIDICRYLWNGEGTAIAAQFADFAIQQTQRENRMIEATSKFLGKEAGLLEGTALEEDKQFFEQVADEIEPVYAMFNALLALKSN